MIYDAPSILSGGDSWTLMDVKESIKEAIEDLPDQESPHVKKLRRMYERTPPISGCGMFGVER